MTQSRFYTSMDRRDSASLEITPPQIVGPFYPVTERPDLAADLARPRGSAAEAEGQLIYVRGRVLTSSGEPVVHARIDIWQANAAGKYRHPSDTNPAPLDPNFKGFARLTTDASGRYSFRTIKPGRYPTAEGDIRPPHIHFAVEGRFDRLVTQLYFAGEAENQTDRWLNAAPRPERLIVTLEEPASQIESRALVAHFDIVLPSG
jgi:protocatechuate 3,4-dioxygenase, beta subunit